VKFRVSIAFVSLLALAGCETSSGDGGIPVQTGGLVVPESQMADFCKAQAARQFGPSIESITTDMPAPAPDGTVIRGRWSTPVSVDAALAGTTDPAAASKTPPTGAFDCRYGTGGYFHGVLRTG